MNNVLVAQSGGPSPVINASLLGVLDMCRSYPDRFGTVYAGYRGIEGVLKEELMILSDQPEEELALLKTTPSAGAIGTCRYKLHDEGSPDYARIIEVFKAHDIGYFFYIGGNDSMDTANKVSKAAEREGYPLICTGIPKTIDNDVGDPTFQLLDHTPGYGSCARYWALLMQNALEENRAISTSECVSVYQAMGRKAGFITAAARLGDPERKHPLLMFFAESNLTLEELSYKVNDMLVREGRCVVVVNEGFDTGASDFRHDGFGHVEYGASGITAMQAVVNYLNRQKLPVRGQATGQIPGVIQRSTAIFASQVDIDEAYAVGRHAVTVALTHGTGYMATIIRLPGETYQAGYSHVPLADVAGSERFLPQSWITPDQTDVTDDFIRYARPLIGDEMAQIPMENGLQRFARLFPLFVEKKTKPYIPAGL
ncbi:MAG TPA: diphosphate--fructose-6-phosphate 1-phosphotransferase [Clostridiales bacterium]|jgi:6-phosphofructokinase 1|nr:diphosphate--fructose-6-phosphate 1-phosphotransferase [Clostridiales bacterium]